MGKKKRRKPVTQPKPADETFVGAYKRSLARSQIMILVVLAIAWWMGQPLPLLLMLFVLLQIASAAGVWMGLRLRKRIERASNRLPLER